MKFCGSYVFNFGAAQGRVNQDRRRHTNMCEANSLDKANSYVTIPRRLQLKCSLHGS